MKEDILARLRKEREFHRELEQEYLPHEVVDAAIEEIVKLRAALERARPYLVDHVAMTADDDDFGDRLALDAVDAAMEQERENIGDPYEPMPPGLCTCPLGFTPPPHSDGCKDRAGKEP